MFISDGIGFPNELEIFLREKAKSKRRRRQGRKDFASRYIFNSFDCLFDSMRIRKEDFVLISISQMNRISSFSPVCELNLRLNDLFPIRLEIRHSLKFASCVTSKIFNGKDNLHFLLFIVERKTFFHLDNFSFCSRVSLNNLGKNLCVSWSLKTWRENFFLLGSFSLIDRSHRVWPKVESWKISFRFVLEAKWTRKTIRPSQCSMMKIIQSELERKKIVDRWSK